jgi:putative DNA primase/helicase
MNQTKRSSEKEETYMKGDTPKLILQPTPKEVLNAYIADQLLKEHAFKTLRDTDELLVYLDGVYRFNGETCVAEGVEAALKGVRNASVSNRLIGEVIGHIKRRTYVDREEFNSKLNLLNLKNGILNINTMKVVPHSKDFLSTARLPIKYEPNAKCPRITKFFSEIVESEHIPLLEEVFGWCLDAHSPIRQMVLLLGETHTGKSTYLELLRQYLGGDNCSAVPLQNLSYRFSLASLYGKLANIFADLSSSTLRETSMFKTLTGGDAVQAEEKFKRPFTFRPTAKLIFSANTPPKIYEDTKAIWGRFVVIPFPNEFWGAADDKKLLSKLTTSEELSGLLNLALSALKRLKLNGELTYSASLEQVRDTYLISADPVQAFLEECCYITPEKWISKEELFREFIQFCSEKHVPGYTKTKLGRELTHKGQFRPRGTGWQGVTLKRLVSEEEINEQGKETVIRLNLSSN